jgi:hypothetical protein
VGIWGWVDTPGEKGLRQLEDEVMEEWNGGKRAFKMKWFKHLAGSLNNSFIFELVNKFGGDGYLVFFGTLEIMADEFDVYQPGFNRFLIKKLTKNLQLSRQKTVKIWKFIDEKARENPQKSVGFFVSVKDQYVEINCPKLRELCDEYTEKQLSKKSGQCRDNVGSLSGQCREQETETEEDSRDILSIDNISPGGDHFSQKVGGYLDSILEACRTILKLPPKKKPFNPFQWVQFWANKTGHPQAILESLQGLISYWDQSGIDSPWSYANSIMKTKNGNYNEREHIRESERFKEMLLDPKMQDLLKGIGG